MSTGILLTGKRGQGKSLAAVGRIREYLSDDKCVATNLDLFLENMFSIDNKKVRVYRLPDYPTTFDLLNLPLGNKKLFYRDDGSIGYQNGYTDENNGLLVLDEAASFLNARDWNDKEKKASRDSLNDWLRHSRKYGWDILMLTQHEDLIDKQTRSALFEMVGVCKRLDRMSIPLISFLTKALGYRVMPPKIHMAVIRYGMSLDSPVSDRWIYRGASLYNCYDTTQVLGKDQISGVCTLLTPYHLKGRYLNKLGYLIMYAKVAAIALIIGILSGAFIHWTYSKIPRLNNSNSKDTQIASSVFETSDTVYIVGEINQDGNNVIFLSDGRSVKPEIIERTKNSIKIHYQNKIYSTN